MSQCESSGNRRALLQSSKCCYPLSNLSSPVNYFKQLSWALSWIWETVSAAAAWVYKGRVASNTAPATDLTGEVKEWRKDKHTDTQETWEKLPQLAKLGVLIRYRWARRWCHCMHKKRKAGLASFCRGYHCVCMGWDENNQCGPFPYTLSTFVFRPGGKALTLPWACTQVLWFRSDSLTINSRA